jgi:hypothetical protein
MNASTTQHLRGPIRPGAGSVFDVRAALRSLHPVPPHDGVPSVRPYGRRRAAGLHSYR